MTIRPEGLNGAQYAEGSTGRGKGARKAYCDSMDRKILRNAEKRQGLIDELYADHDISLKEQIHLTMENQHDTRILLKADRRYDAKKR